MGKRKRYRLVAKERVLDFLGGCAGSSLAANYEQVISEAVAAREFERNPIWTESIAVGDEAFVDVMEERIRNRVELTKEENNGQWVLRETSDEAYV